MRMLDGWREEKGRGVVLLCKVFFCLHYGIITIPNDLLIPMHPNA